MTGKRVLIVDDALELGRMLRFALESLEAGLDVRVVPSAEEAMLEASRQPVSLIVVDFRLPGMTGLELIDKIRASSKDTRFILITGMSDDRIVQKARELKADRFMPKPLQISEFLEVASQLLGISVSKEGPLPVAVQEETQQTEESASAADLAGVLIRLRQSLGAQVALVANDHGQIIAQAGDLGGIHFEESWAPLIMEAISAAGRLGRLLQFTQPASAQVVRGEAASLVLAPVGVYALLVLLKAEQSGLRTALAVEETLSAQKELAAILERSGAPFQILSEPAGEPEIAHPAAEPLEIRPPVEEPALGEFEDLIKGKAQVLDRKKAEHFWEEASGSTPFLSDNPEVITYDQARKLGLTPEEDERT